MAGMIGMIMMAGGIVCGKTSDKGNSATFIYKKGEDGYLAGKEKGLLRITTADGWNVSEPYTVGDNEIKITESQEKDDIVITVKFWRPNDKGGEDTDEITVKTTGYWIEFTSHAWKKSKGGKWWVLTVLGHHGPLKTLARFIGASGEGTRAAIKWKKITRTNTRMRWEALFEKQKKKKYIILKPPTSYYAFIIPFKRANDMHSVLPFPWK